MALIRPFSGIRFARDKFDGGDISKVIAPPYDVLDDMGKSGLQSRHPNNIVTVDLPHLPAKAAGLDDVYEKAHLTLQSWLRAAELSVSFCGVVFGSLHRQHFDDVGCSIIGRRFKTAACFRPNLQTHDAGTWRRANYSMRAIRQYFCVKRICRKKCGWLKGVSQGGSQTRNAQKR